MSRGQMLWKVFEKSRGELCCPEKPCRSEALWFIDMANFRSRSLVDFQVGCIDSFVALPRLRCRTARDGTQCDFAACEDAQCAFANWQESLPAYDKPQLYMRNARKHFTIHSNGLTCFAVPSLVPCCTSTGVVVGHYGTRAAILAGIFGAKRIWRENRRRDKLIS